MYFILELLLERTGYSVWIDLLYFGYFFVCGSTREWIYCILDIVHILKWIVQLCRLSEYFYIDICCDWISKSSQDKDSLCYQILNGSQTLDGSHDRSQDRLLDLVDKNYCQLQWPGQIGFIIVSLYVLWWRCWLFY